MKHVFAAAALAAALGGCNETISRSTTAGKPVILGAMAMYDGSDCTAWEPPEGALASAPANGSVSFALVQTPMQKAGHVCHGSRIPYRVATYTPRPGFRGQDRASILFNMITSDGGGRAARGASYLIDVK